MTDWDPWRSYGMSVNSLKKLSHSHSRVLVNHPLR